MTHPFIGEFLCSLAHYCQGATWSPWGGLKSWPHAQIAPSSEIRIHTHVILASITILWIFSTFCIPAELYSPSHQSVSFWWAWIFEAKCDVWIKLCLSGMAGKLFKRLKMPSGCKCKSTLCSIQCAHKTYYLIFRVYILHTVWVNFTSVQCTHMCTMYTHVTGWVDVYQRIVSSC